MITIIGILVSLLLPGVQAAREAARRTTCNNNLRQIGLAMHSYHDMKGKLPYASNNSEMRKNPNGTDCLDYAKSGDTQPTKCLEDRSWPNHNWSVFMMPQLEMGALYDQIDLSTSLDNTTNRTLLSGRRLTAFECPSNGYVAAMTTLRSGSGFQTPYPQGYRQPVGCYSPCSGPSRWSAQTAADDCPTNNSFCSVQNSLHTGSRLDQTPGMFSGRTVLQVSFGKVVDGLSSTIMLAERRGELNVLLSQLSLLNPVVWTGNRINSPQIDITDATKVTGVSDYSHSGASSHHPGGAGFCMGDGSVQFFNDNIDFSVYNGLGCRDDASFGITTSSRVP